MPDIESLRLHMQRLAAIDAVFAAEGGERDFVFEPRWRKHQQVAMIINGGGDELFIHFKLAGCFLKGFAHESVMTPYNDPDFKIWPGVLDSVPKEFDSSLKEPAFYPEATTFAIWRLTTDAAWSTGAVTFPPHYFKDGSSDLLHPITFTATDFTEWLAENCETEIDEEIVQSVFAGKPLSDQQMLKLNPSAKLHVMRNEVRRTGYPIQADQ